MSSFAQSLAHFSNSAFARLSEAAIAKICHEHRLYTNEVEPATRVVDALRRGARTVLLAHPMQSGKTNIMAATTHFLRQLIPDVRAIYVCAHDQIDFRRQNRLALAPHVELLSRSERKKSGKMVIDRPTIVFYDESHFGDGADMTIEQYLLRQGVFNHPLAVFCGVSATPMTSIGCVDEPVFADMTALEEAGYNSPRMMLENGRIQHSEPLFQTPKPKDLGGRRATVEDVQILTNNRAYRHLAEILDADTRQGYVLIRCHKIEADVLAAHLQEQWGNRVYVEHWNQHNKEFSADTFFSQRRFGVITVVLVQHKARMGSVIDTETCHFMYEPASTRSKVDVIAQSFIGRACGFNKQNHSAIIYSRPQVAEAYTILMTRDGRTRPFAKFCQERKLKPALRAQLSSGGVRYALARLDAIPARAKDSTEAIRSRVRGLIAAHDLEQGRGHVRTLSRNVDLVKAGILDARGRARPHKAEDLCGPMPGDWMIVTYDRKPSSARHEKGIILAIRGTRLVADLPDLAPTDASFHAWLRRRRLGQALPRQESLGFPVPAETTSWAAAAP